MSVLRDIVSVRVVQYVANYAGLACGLLIFSMAAGTRPLLPKFVAIVLAGVCFVGNAATLSRSDWLALVFGVAAAIVAIPRYRIVTKIAYSLAVLPVLSLFLFTSIYVAGQVSGRDIFGKMQTRLISMLPGEHEGVKKNASDSRLPGTIAELQWWTSSPFIGRGFGIHDAKSIQDITLANSGFRHNVWSSTLAETGIIGFSAMAILCFGQVVLGWRMIKLRIERSFVFIGGLGVITGVYYIIHGLATMSFNQLRFAIPLAITWGVVLRCRAMQLALAREYAGYLPVAESVSRDALPPVLEDGAVPAPFVF